MTLTVHPRSILKGKFFLPASKSHSIRAFIIASQGGESSVIHPSGCDDALVSIAIAKQLGSVIKHKGKIFSVNAHAKKVEASVIDVGESGTSLRFLLPILALYNQTFKVIGRGTLKGRPNFHLTETLRNMGVDIQGEGPRESVPLTIRGGDFRGGKIFIDGSLSSQFISALLIACPSLPQDTYLEIAGKRIVSSTYVTMTLQVLKEAGITIKKINDWMFYIPGSQDYKGLKHFLVPSDYGLAAYFIAAGALVPSHLSLQGHLDDKFLQSDGKILEFARTMGIKFTKTKTSLQIKGPFILKGGKFSLKDCPDLVPVMAVMALFAKGPTRLCDIGHARAKESDRISDLRKELLNIGADVKEKKDELIIFPKPFYRKNVFLDSHRDHRLAMAFSVLGLKVGARVKDIEVVSKSYPDFVRDFKSIGALKALKPK